MQKTLNSIVVLVFNHLSPGTLDLPFQLFACNVIFLDLGLKNFSIDLRMVNHVRQDIFEVLYAKALHPTHNIGDINFNKFGLFLSDSIFIFDARRTPFLRLDWLV
jgi:hypothetical protein